MGHDALDAARQFESLVLRRVFEASGAFHGSSLAGSSVREGMFVEALADAVANAGGLGLTETVAKDLGAPDVASPPPTLPRQDSGAIPGARVTSAYGTRIDPLDGRLSRHEGVDLAAEEGAPIHAVAPGIVRSAGFRGGYGETVEIDHGGGVSTLYAHASALRVRSGDRIEEGDTIALAGHTGRATGPHLHFELRVDGRPVDPARALKVGQGRDDTEGNNP